VCARLGGDEFIIFAPDCDLDGAKAIARQILDRLSKHEMPLAGVKFSVSIGIALHEGADNDFAKLYMKRCIRRGLTARVASASSRHPQARPDRITPDRRAIPPINRTPLTGRA